jgi:hypothetical protein
MTHRERRHLGSPQPTSQENGQDRAISEALGGSGIRCGDRRLLARCTGGPRAWRRAIDADSKLVCSWLVGKRDPGCATEFIQDLAGRLSNRAQLTTDGRFLLQLITGLGSPDQTRFLGTLS